MRSRGPCGLGTTGSGEKTGFWAHPLEDSNVVLSEPVIDSLCRAVEFRHRIGTLPIGLHSPYNLGTNQSLLHFVAGDRRLWPEKPAEATLFILLTHQFSLRTSALHNTKVSIHNGINSKREGQLLRFLRDTGPQLSKSRRGRGPRRTAPDNNCSANVKKEMNDTFQ
jgi:hypothetical protein